MKLLESKTKCVSMPIAHILCGIGLKDLEKFYELFNLSNSNPEVKVGQIGALKMLSYKQRIADEAVKKVLAQSESCERSVRNAAIYFMLLAEINDEGARARLRQLAVEGDQDDKVMIACNSFHLAGKHKTFCLELIKLCLQSDDPDILNNMQLSMDSIAHDFPVECLEIVQKWFRNDALQDRINLLGVAEQIEKGEGEKVDAFLLKWIAEEQNRLVLMFYLPKLIEDMFAKGDKGRLLQILGQIDITREEGLVACAKVIEDILSDPYGKPDQTFIRGCYDLACKIAQSKNVDYTKIKIEKENEVLLTLAILSDVRSVKKQIDFSQVLPNLGQYPNIKWLLGNKWFEDNILSKDEKQPLIWLLARFKPKEEEIKEHMEALNSCAGNPMRQWTIYTSLRRKLNRMLCLNRSMGR
jgi:hypothetical protein